MDDILSRREALLRVGKAAMLFGSGEQANAASDSGEMELALTRISAKTIRITLSPVAQRDAADAGDFAIAAPLNGKRILTMRSFKAPRTVNWGEFRLRISGSPLTVSVEDGQGKTVQFVRMDDRGSIAFKGSAGPVFGLGEGEQQFDRRNGRYSMRNGQFRPLLANIGARMPIPWLVAADGWAVFFNRPFGTLDLSGTEYRFEPEENAPGKVALDLFLVLSRNPADLLKEYCGITGFPHMPPLWSLGYQQSHRTLSNRQEVMDEAVKFRQEGLPCDTMIYLGTGFCPSGWNTGHGSFTFNPNVFPDPKRMIDVLHDEHFHVVLHLTMPPDRLKGTVGDAATTPDTNDAGQYWATHRDTFRLGVDGWWPDEGDKLAPESRLARDRMYWEGPLRERPNQRPFALHRNGYAGLQRFGWLWSGDVDCSWKTLQEQIPVGLNTGLSGIPYWGTDTGGFVPTKELTGELYVRWFQFSAFCPLFRSHGREWKLRLPWGWNTGEYGPLETDEKRLPDPAELHNSQVLPICKKYLELRYRLLPYLYSAVRETHETGIPLMRALWLQYPEDSQGFGVADQYLWGRDILVAPVTQQGAKSRRLYLPPGKWFDFWTEGEMPGGKVIEREVDLATLPLYVRAGAILALGPLKQYVSETSKEALLLRIHAGADGESFLYADDGESFAFERNEFMRMKMRWNDVGRELTLSLDRGSKKVWEGYRDIEVEILPGGERKHVTFEGRPLTVRL